MRFKKLENCAESVESIKIIRNFRHRPNRDPHKNPNCDRILIILWQLKINNFVAERPHELVG